MVGRWCEAFAVWRVRPLSGSKAERVGRWESEEEAKQVAENYCLGGDFAYVLCEMLDERDVEQDDVGGVG